MDFGAIPPEVNSARLYSGPGAEPMLAAATAWDKLAGELDWTASSYSSEISSLTCTWAGSASASMASAAAHYVAWMSATATLAEQAATQALAAASAYEVALAGTVPPPAIAANRALLATLVATNVLGQNNPAIAAAETHYSQMWVQNAAAMYGYAESSAAAAMLTPFPPPPQIAKPAGLAAQATSLAHTAAISAGTATHEVLHATVVALQTLNLSGDVISSLELMCMVPNALKALNPYAAAATAPPAVPFAALASAQVGAESAALRSAGVANGGSTASATLGRAATIGGLSVPPAWVTQTPAIGPAAMTAPAAGLSADPTVGTAGSEVAMASGLGSVVGGMAGAGRATPIPGASVAREWLRANVLPQPQYLG